MTFPNTRLHNYKRRARRFFSPLLRRLRILRHPNALALFLSGICLLALFYLFGAFADSYPPAHKFHVSRVCTKPTALRLVLSLDDNLNQLEFRADLTRAISPPFGFYEYEPDNYCSDVRMVVPEALAAVEALEVGAENWSKIEAFNLRLYAEPDGIKFHAVRARPLDGLRPNCVQDVSEERYTCSSRSAGRIASVKASGSLVSRLSFSKRAFLFSIGDSVRTPRMPFDERVKILDAFVETWLHLPPGVTIDDRYTVPPPSYVVPDTKGTFYRFDLKNVTFGSEKTNSASTSGLIVLEQSTLADAKAYLILILSILLGIFLGFLFEQLLGAKAVGWRTR